MMEKGETERLLAGHGDGSDAYGGSSSAAASDVAISPATAAPAKQRPGLPLISEYVLVRVLPCNNMRGDSLGFSKVSLLRCHYVLFNLTRARVTECRS